MCICTQLHVHTQMDTHTHTYTHIHTNTHKCAHACSRTPALPYMRALTQGAQHPHHIPITHLAHQGQGREVCSTLLQEELGINPALPLPPQQSNRQVWEMPQQRARRPQQQQCVHSSLPPTALRQLQFDGVNVPTYGAGWHQHGYSPWQQTQQQQWQQQAGGVGHGRVGEEEDEEGQPGDEGRRWVQNKTLEINYASSVSYSST